MRIGRLLGAIAVVAALVAAGLWLLGDRPAPAPARTAEQDRAQLAPTGSPGELPGATAPAPPEPPAGAARPRLTAERRRELLARLARARERRQTAAPDGRAGPPGQQPIAPLDLADKTGSTSDWQRRQLDTLNQLLAECYDLAAADEPDLAGSLGVQFTIAGEPEIGGLVDDVSIMEGYSTIEQATLRECVTESLYALELDPPPDGVRVGRQITLRFEPD